MKNKFSYYISELSKVWWEWMKADTAARDHSISYETRREFAEKCEELIKEEYVIIDKLNLFFKSGINE